MKSRDQLLSAFNKASTVDELRALMVDALALAQFLEASKAMAEGRTKKLQDQVARQATIISGLNSALSNDRKA